MTESSFQQLGKVQRTMVIPLFARAKESLRKDPIVFDERAGEILRQIDYDTTELEKESDILQVVACVAATIFDRWTRNFLEEHPEGTIVEIGSGLDTRFERLDNGRAQWFDIDLPDSIAVRRQFFEETPRRRMIAGSILEESWIEEVKASHPTALLFVAEGVLFYFKEEDVKSLYQLIADHFPGALFATIVLSGELLENHRGSGFARSGVLDFSGALMISTKSKRGMTGSRFSKSIPSSITIDHVIPRIIRFFTWLVPNLRRVFTTNLVKLG